NTETGPCANFRSGRAKELITEPLIGLQWGKPPMVLPIVPLIPIQWNDNGFLPFIIEALVNPDICRPQVLCFEQYRPGRGVVFAAGGLPNPAFIDRARQG